MDELRVSERRVDAMMFLLVKERSWVSNLILIHYQTGHLRAIVMSAHA